MSNPKSKPGASDAEVIAMLQRYHCPTPFHEVRTRFLGNIATPLTASPLEVVKGLWGGELPEFDKMDDVNALFGVLVAGLWNRLTTHQDGRNPFRLLRFEVAPTREGALRLAQTRLDELDGFVDGLFGSASEIHLPESAHEALVILGELRGMFAGSLPLLQDEAKPASAADLKDLIQNFQKLSIIAEAEMHKIVPACKHARAGHVAAMAVTRPTLH